MITAAIEYKEESTTIARVHLTFEEYDYRQLVALFGHKGTTDTLRDQIGSQIFKAVATANENPGLNKMTQTETT